jgi:lysophospholipase L1-like esterase
MKAAGWSARPTRNRPFTGGIAMARIACLLLILFSLGVPQDAFAQDHKWVVSWTASAHGPYPVGNPSAQPDQKFAFPSPAAGANDQTFRLIVRPDIWGRQARLRLTNVFGTRPVTFDGVFAGLQLGGPAVLKGTNRPVTFGGKASVTVAPGESAWSDAVDLPFVRDPAATELAGRKLAVSFHVVGESGPMTWHAKALTTSYVTAPGAGSKGMSESEADFPFSTASWFFLDAVEMMAPSESFAIMTFGDSITDGTASTMNGDDRWPDVLSRRLHALHGNRIAVVNGGIGGNQIGGPAEYGANKPFPGGPSAKSRIERDVLDLSGVGVLVWLEGINDFSKNGNAALETVQDTLKEAVGRIRARRPDIRIIGATVVTALGSSSAAHGFPEQDEKRKALNAFIRGSGLFDGVIDFDAVTRDPQSGSLKAEFVPESTTGGPGDKLHPNRAGYLAMGMAIDLDLMQPKPQATR